MRPSLSIIIPTYRESGSLPETLPPLLGVSDAEVIVVDGASPDGTASVAARLGARVLSAARCRGGQLDLGAREARGENLLFLHGDARPPEGFLPKISNTLANGKVVLGSFSLRLDGADPYLRLVERATALRLRITGTPYGDQGLFLRRVDYLLHGGFRHWPLLEDLELVRRLRRHGRIAVLPDAVVVSARRYMRDGRLRTSLRYRVASILWMFRLPAPLIWSAMGHWPDGVDLASDGSARSGLAEK